MSSSFSLYQRPRSPTFVMYCLALSTVLFEVILSFTGELLLILVLLKLFCATELFEPALDSFRSVFEFLGSPLRSEVFLLLLKASFRLICNFQGTNQ